MTLADAKHSLDLYAGVDRVRPGSFLQAVLANDLRDAVAHCGRENEPLIPEIVRYVYCSLPGVCQGSWDKVYAWLARNEER